jgi:hypothetical protein
MNVEIIPNTQCVRAVFLAVAGLLLTIRNLVGVARERAAVKVLVNVRAPVVSVWTNYREYAPSPVTKNKSKMRFKPFKSFNRYAPFKSLNITESAPVVQVGTFQ